MPNPVVHFEIHGTDRSTLATFYAELFGWHVESMPAEMNYEMVDTHADGGINGGITTMQGPDPMITFYVEVDDPQKFLNRAESLGGKTVVPVTEIPNAVTFALFTDPDGNTIGLVKSGEGPGVSEGSNPEVGWFEVHSPNVQKAWHFYRDLFGWDIKEHITDQFSYGEVDTGTDRGIGGGITSSKSGKPMVTIYADVDDLTKYLERAESLGAKRAMEPMQAQENLSIAAFVDPQGNWFGLYHSAH